MELKMNYNARGIRWIVLLTKDLTGLIVDGLGSGAYQRVDGRMRVDNILPIAEDKMKRANNKMKEGIEIWKSKASDFRDERL